MITIIKLKISKTINNNNKILKFMVIWIINNNKFIIKTK